MCSITSINLAVLFGAVIYISMHAMILISHRGYKINVSKKEKYALQVNNKYHLLNHSPTMRGLQSAIRDKK